MSLAVPWRHLRALPLEELAGKAAARLRRGARIRLEAWRARRGALAVDEADFAHALSAGMTAEQLVLRLRSDDRRLFQPVDETFFRELARRFPETLSASREEAARICRHELRIVGPRRRDLGPTIDWHRDPESGHRWDASAYFKLVPEAGAGGADVLFPWWLSSFYQLIPLGKVYRLSRVGLLGIAPEEGERCAQEFRRQIESWIDANPYPFGINWKSTTIVALRLIHWLWALLLFRDHAGLPASFWSAYLRQLLLHGRHLRANLEWFPVRTNHYLTNLVGLLYLAVLLPELAESPGWLDFARRELIGEIEHHTYPDGVVHEGSLNYHRYDGEIFLATAWLLSERGRDLPASYERRLERLLEVLVVVRRPDGELPRIGDHSDIRLQELESRDAADPRALLAVGAVRYGRGEFKRAAGAFPEYAYWLVGEKGCQAFERLAADAGSPGSRSFGSGGLHVIRDRRLHLVIRCGPLGLRGVAGHGHYDQLAFDLGWLGRPVLIDPGWFRYEADPELFRYFKSTAAHNTVVVDDRDQLAVDRFSYPPPRRPEPQSLEWKIAEDEVRFCGEHGLYGDLPQPVVHRRTLRYLPAERAVCIEDDLLGAGAHRLEWNFHLAAGFAVVLRGREAHFSDGVAQGTLIPAVEPLEVSLVDGWVAPVYGFKQRAPVVRWRWSGELPLALHARIEFEGGDDA